MDAFEFGPFPRKLNEDEIAMLRRLPVKFGPSYKHEKDFILLWRRPDAPEVLLLKIPSGQSYLGRGYSASHPGQVMVVHCGKERMFHGVNNYYASLFEWLSNRNLMVKSSEIFMNWKSNPLSDAVSAIKFISKEPAYTKGRELFSK